jgi:allantoin racemase
MAMRILIINPNTTESMTRKVEAVAQRVARPDTEIIATNPALGPPSIQGYHDAATCVPHLLEVIKEHPQVDAIIIACFDDTGLDAARCAVDVPVVGIGESAYHVASILANKFSVITTLGRSVPGLEANLQRYGLDQRCARVIATEIPVLKLEENDPATLEKIKGAIRDTIADDMAEAIVLGCAGMTDLMEQLSDEFGLPVLDGVTCAVTLVEGLVAAKVKTSKIGGYSFPI